jgi:PKD repeat protein
MSTRRIILIVLVASATLLTVRTSAAPAAPPMPPAFLISDSFGYGFDPALAYNSQHDEYLAVWGDPYDIYARRVSSRGELLGNEFVVAADFDDREAYPSVAYDSVNDRYLVVWAREVATDNWDVYGRFIPWDGNPTAGEFAIDSSASDASYSPKVAYALSQGEYLVVWEDYALGWPEYVVRGRRVKAVGGGWPAKFTIASHPSENRCHPAVAYNLARNEYLVTYDDYYGGGTNNEDIYAKRLTGEGVVLGGELNIAGWPDDELKPAVSACHLVDQYLVTWTSVQSGGNRVYARFVGGAGTLEGVYQIDDSTVGYPFSPAALACRWGVQHMLTWERLAGGSSVGIWGRVVHSDESMDASFEIAAPEYPHRENPAVACGSPNCLVAWEQRDASGYAEVYGRILGETKPRATFSVSPMSGDTSTVFEFDASASTDIEDPSSALYVRWDWENDGTWDTAWSTTKTATHQYMIPCGIALSLKTVRLEVLDTYGLTDSATSDYVQVSNTPPTAAFTVTPEVGDNTTYFVFDASGSSDAECATSNLEVRWDWEDDGTWDTLWSTIKTAGVTFGAAGYGWQTTRLEVRDSPGLTDTTTDGVMIDHAPTASFTVNPTSGNVTTAFLFDPTSSTDPDVGYYSLHAQWDWEDDGTWDTPWLMCWETVNHTYDAPGTYTVRLQVRQAWPSLTDSTTRHVQVVNTAPTAAFTVDPTTGDTSTTFQLDASASSDLEDPITALEVRWDYDGDGTYDSGWTTTKTANVGYPSPGTYVVRLQVRDTEGLTHSTTRQVTVQPPSPNAPPNASFTVSPTTGHTNTVFQFDASGSTDAEDPISALQVRWDWQNDGIFETGWRTGKTVKHTFDAAGIHTVRMELRDTDGLTDATTRQVTVEALRFTYLPLVLRWSTG